MDVYDEFEVIDADTKRCLGRFIDLKSARNMAHIWVTPPHNHRSIEIWGRRGKEGGSADRSDDHSSASIRPTLLWSDLARIIDRLPLWLKERGSPLDSKQGREE